MKVREVFKKGIAGFLTAVMILGNSANAFAADDVNADVPAYEEEAVSEDELTAEETGAEDEDTEEEENVSKSRETGDGSISNPYNIELNVDVEGKLEIGSNKLHHYVFTVEKDGFLMIEISALEGSLRADLFHDSIDDNGRMCYYYVNNPNDGIKTFAKVGLKAGTKYYVGIGGRASNVSDAYKIKLNFTESKYWEAEPDSILDYKADIEMNKWYEGSTLLLGNDPTDYYSFKLNKKTKIAFVLTGVGSVAIGTSDLFDDSIAGGVNPLDGERILFTKEFNAGTYYLRVGNYNNSYQSYKFMMKTSGQSSNEDKKKKYPETGTLLMNEVEYKSLQEAVANMTSDTDYTIELQSNLVGEKSITLPKKVKSVTIKGSDHSIVMKGSKITANCPLSLEGVTIKAENAKKEGVKSKLSINAKKGLSVGAEVSFDAVSTTINVKEEMQLMDAVSVNSVTAEKLTLKPEATYILGAGDKLTVKKELKAEEGSEIYLLKGFKPIALKGTASGRVVFNAEENLADGTQVLNCSSKKISTATLKEVFDCTDLTANHTDTYLYYLSGSKACIFGDNIEFNGKEYGLWKDVVTDMNAAVKEAKKNNTTVSFNVALKGNVNMAGKFTLPKKGYEGLTIEGNGNSLTFTSDIKLTGNLTISDDTTLIKVNKKNEKVAGKIKEGKFTYTGPQITQ